MLGLIWIQTVRHSVGILREFYSICPICFLLLSMHQWYGMDALNGTLKHLKIQNEAAILVTGLTRSLVQTVWLVNPITKKTTTYTFINV